MIDEQRIILMSKLASYEERDGKKYIKIGKFFRTDYIALQLLKAFFGGTISFLMGFALYIFYDFEIFMMDIYKMDLMEFAKRVLFLYLGVVGIYAVISYIIYTVRYNRAKKSLKLYYMNLRRLANMYK